MSQKQWEPLTTAEAVIEAIKAGRHVEFTIQPDGWIELFGRALHDPWEMLRIGGRYRALIAPAQPASSAKPMNIIEETHRILHGEEYRGMHPDVDRLLRALARLKPAVYRCAVGNSPLRAYLEDEADVRSAKMFCEPDHVNVVNLYILEPTND